MGLSNKSAKNTTWFTSSTIFKASTQTILVETISECPICFYQKKLVSIRCVNNHSFCENCIKKWRSKSEKCPMCRQPSFTKSNGKKKSIYCFYSQDDID